MAGTLTVRGLQGAVAVVTARLAGLDDLPQEQILGDTPPQEALHALSVLLASVLGAIAPQGIASAVRVAGALASEMEASHGNT